MLLQRPVPLQILLLLLLLLHLLLPLAQLCSGAAHEPLFKATKCLGDPECSDCNCQRGTWSLQLPVWPQLLSSSTGIEVHLAKGLMECTERPTVRWVSGSNTKELKTLSSVLLAAPPESHSPMLLVTESWGCPTKGQPMQSANLTLSGSGFKQEVSVVRSTGGCQLLEVISRQVGLNNSLQSLDFALCLSPQPSNFELLFEKSTRLSIYSLNKTGRFVRSADSEQISVDAAGLSRELAHQLELTSEMKWINGSLKIGCHPASSSGSHCSCLGLDTKIWMNVPPRPRKPQPAVELNWHAIWISASVAVILLMAFAASTRRVVRTISKPKLLVVSLDGDVEELRDQLTSLPLQGLRLSLLDGHRLDEGSLQRALRCKSSARVKTFLLAGVNSVLSAESRPAAARTGLKIWLTESARFSLLLYQPPAAAAAVSAGVEQPLLNALQQILGPAEALDGGAPRWAVIDDAEAGAAYFMEELQALDDEPEADDDLQEAETAV